MYQTLSTSEAVDILQADTYARWSRSGARALVEHLEAQEADEAEAIELDATALRCDWSEYPSAVEAASDLSDWEYRPDEDGRDYDEDEAEQDALDYLHDRTEVITFPGGVIVRAF
jgi:hypothetical protein